MPRCSVLQGLLTQREVEELEQAMLDYYQGRGFALHRVVEVSGGGRALA